MGKRSRNAAPFILSCMVFTYEKYNYAASI